MAWTLTQTTQNGWGEYQCSGCPGVVHVKPGETLKAVLAELGHTKAVCRAEQANPPPRHLAAKSALTGKWVPV